MNIRLEATFKTLSTEFLFFDINDNISLMIARDKVKDVHLKHNENVILDFDINTNTLETKINNISEFKKIPNIKQTLEVNNTVFEKIKSETSSVIFLDLGDIVLSLGKSVIQDRNSDVKKLVFSKNYISLEL